MTRNGGVPLLGLSPWLWREQWPHLFLTSVRGGSAGRRGATILRVILMRMCALAERHPVNPALVALEAETGRPVEA